MRKRWHFTFKGKGYKHFDCDAEQVRAQDPMQCILKGWVAVDRIGEPKITRWINMTTVAFIEIVEHPSQPDRGMPVDDETPRRNLLDRGIAEAKAVLHDKEKGPWPEWGDSPEGFDGPGGAE